MSNVETLVVIFDNNLENLLFCKKEGTPNIKLNFMGGKKNYCEHDTHCAYREFREETGIMSNHVHMDKIMSIHYSCRKPASTLSVFSCVLGFTAYDIVLKEERSPLVWIPVQGTNFFDTDKFAGNGIIGLIVNEALKYWENNK